MRRESRRGGRREARIGAAERSEKARIKGAKRREKTRRKGAKRLAGSKRARREGTIEWSRTDDSDRRWHPSRDVHPSRAVHPSQRPVRPTRIPASIRVGLRTRTGPHTGSDWPLSESPVSESPYPSRRIRVARVRVIRIRLGRPAARARGGGRLVSAGAQRGAIAAHRRNCGSTAQVRLIGAIAAHRRRCG